MRLRSIIVDDEPPARKGMAEELREVAFVEIAGIAGNSFEAMELLTMLKPDLIFLDITLPRLNGLDLIKSLKEPPMVIIITAYPQYALQGYELDVIDYLIKPVDPRRLQKACQRAYEFFALRQQALQGSKHPGAYFFVKCDGKYEKILFSDLLFIEAADNYVFAHCKTRKFMIHDTMKNMEDLLPPEKFMKVHKSFIVGLDHVLRIENNGLVLGSHLVPVSRNCRKTLIEKMTKTGSRD